jgi:hypothetical protein
MSRLEAVSRPTNVSSPNSLAMSRSHLGFGAERLGLGLGLEGSVYIPAIFSKKSVGHLGPPV